MDRLIAGPVVSSPARGGWPFSAMLVMTPWDRCGGRDSYRNRRNREIASLIVAGGGPGRDLGAGGGSAIAGKPVTPVPAMVSRIAIPDGRGE